MIEREVAAMISEAELLEHMHILDKTTAPKRALQINYYYDTPGFINNTSGNTLRIRQKGAELKLQYKYDKHYSGKERICREFEMTVYLLPMSIQSDALPNQILLSD